MRTRLRNGQYSHIILKDVLHVPGAMTSLFSVRHPCGEGDRHPAGESRQRLHAVRTNREGEYLNNELNHFYAARGFMLETTAPYTPEQNGKAERRPPTEWYKAALATEKLEEPSTYEKAVSGGDADLWKRAMDEEMTSLHANGAWTLEEAPDNVRAIPVKWIDLQDQKRRGWQH